MVELLPLVGIVLLFWLFIIRPASRRQKELGLMQSSLDVGDEVMLTSGVYARVRELADDHVLVEIADGVVTRDVAHRALDLYEVDGLGLDRLDRAVLDSLCRHFGGGPVGISTLAVAVGEERETVEEVAEPFLVRNGFLARTPRGRVATRAAWEHLGLTPPPAPTEPPGDQTLFES